nr:FAD-linked oxidase C-terminal domain-containing protein [Ktedonobacteraceae bacterium]
MLQEKEIHTLKNLLPKGQVFTDAASLISYEVDAGLDRGKPEGIVFPHNAADVVQLVRWAAANNVPLVARGAGTGLSGGAVAERGGLIVEFSRMNHILSIDEYGRSAVVEPGTINLLLDEQVKQKGLYFPPDPASQRASTIGGNVAENSGGPHCFKYGVTTNYVTGMRVVLADGRLVQIGGVALDYPTYDLTGLITGSEGMLALITAIDVRLVRNPPAIKTMLAVFDSVEQAGTAVSAIIAAGLVPATMEMMDQKIIRIVEAFAHAGLPIEAEAILIIEVDGYAASLDNQFDEISSILLTRGGRDLRIARTEEERNQIWFARKSAAGAVTRLTPSYYTVDITVPRSRLVETLSEVNAICDRYNLRVGYVFHAGDGNLHPLVLIPDNQDRALMERVHHAGREMVEVAVSKGGSLSGEHGVGIEKRAFMSLMHNADELAAMLDIKRAFDPTALLNPGKIFPTPQPKDKEPIHSHTTNGKASHTKLPTSKLFTPATAEEAAAGLVALAAARQKVYIRGSVGTENTNDAAIVLSTTALQGVKTYAPDDLSITVGAGTSLADVQSFLAADHKQVPLVSPWPTATIGGLIAANVNAPLRMRYGAIRDLVLCATVVLADGRVLRTGRPVIKNVAGYDLTKAFVGSHGTLGLITDVTLKLVIQPRTRRTLLLPVENLGQGLLLARKLSPMALVASAIVLYKGTVEGIPGSGSTYTLAYTAEGTPTDVETELSNVRQTARAMGGAQPNEVETPSGNDIWAALVGNTPEMVIQSAPSTRPVILSEPLALSAANGAAKNLSIQVIVRVGVPPKDLPTYINDQAALLNTGTFLADIANGLLYAMLAPHGVQEAASWLEQLRQPALALDGYAMVMNMPGTPEIPATSYHTLDRWGYQPQAIDVMQRLKAQWDPQGIFPAEFLNASQAVPNTASRL